jgi:ubiquinol-cytochrome c reductase iron-sulfur subunit
VRLWQWIVALLTLLTRRVLRRREHEGEDGDGEKRIVAEGSPERGAENAVLILLGIASLFAVGFVIVYGAFSAFDVPNELLGVCLGMSLVFIALALTVVAKRLVVTEELEDEYPEEHREQQSEVAEIVRESGSRITRKRLLITAGAATGGALGVAALTPALSLGPVWDTGPLDRTPWGRGVRVVDETGTPFRAADIEEGTFYTAFPEAADREDIGSSLVLVRVSPSQLKLPPERVNWAPGGILAYSKICTHAGCAVALYRKPTFPVVEPSEALVCPCHYSTFDPFTGGTVTYGPAGRPLPQLPLEIDASGFLRAAGNFSGRVGPSWLNVRRPPTHD